MRRSALCWIWFISLSAVACSDAPTPTGPVPAGGFTPVVSNAVTGTGAASAGAVAPSLSALEPVAFVSLTPGAVPDGTTGTIRDLWSGASRPVTLVEGGFDPVAIPAAAGDTLEITIALAGGGVSLAKAVVPIRRPPRVVRTSPATGRTDVAINATIAVIFSEPINLATVNSQSLQLLKDGVAVPGVIRPDPASAVGVEFVPAQPLSSGAAYQLVLTNTIADGTGDGLEGPLVSDFQTAGEGMMLVFASQPSSGFPGIPTLLRVSVEGVSSHSTIPAYTGLVTLALLTWNYTLDGGAWTVTRELATVAAVNGRAIFENITFPEAGRHRLKATGSGLNPALSEEFGICPGQCPTGVMVTYPTVRLSVGGGVVNGLVYVIGGQHSTGWADENPSVVATVEAYDPATNTWSTRAPMPTARYAEQIVEMNGILYAVGGYTELGFTSPSPVVEAYDPISNTWTTRAPLPHPKSGVGIAVVNGILYAVGGYGASGFDSTVDAYDPATNRWTSRASLPIEHPGGGTVAVNGLIYVAGGLIDVQGDLALSVYDPATDSWSALPPMPPTLVGNSPNILPACIAGHAGRVYVASNDGLGEYEPLTGTWTIHSVSAAWAQICDGMAWNGNVLYLLGQDGLVVYPSPASRR